MKYLVTGVGEPVEVQVDVTVDGALRLTAGAVAHALAAGTGQGGIVPIELDGRRLHVGFARLPDGRYQVVVDGISRVLQVTDPASSGAGVAGAEPDGGAVRAPIPGMVVSVLVAEGAQVEAEQPLVTLYAMKLENEIRAPFAGVVAELGVSEGQAVEKGELLVRLDKSG